MRWWYLAATKVAAVRHPERSESVSEGRTCVWSVLLAACLAACSSADPASSPAVLDEGGASNAGGAPSSGGSTGAGGLATSPRNESGGAPSGSGGAPPNTGSGGISSGAGGTMGGGGSGLGGASVGGASTTCTSSSVTPSEVVFIGDSFIAAPTSQIAPDLENIFQQEGSSAYTAMPRYYQLVGTNMDQISAQYDRAHQENPDIQVVIGDGGGNNVLIYDRSCLTQAPPANTGCDATVQAALAIADTLMGKMETDGVKHFVYFFYPHEPTQGLYQGTAPAINDTLDYTEPLARAVCDRHSICTFVSFREATGDAVGSGYTDRGYINPNDVHPSPAGSTFFANAIWTAMKKDCILTP